VSPPNDDDEYLASSVKKRVSDWSSRSQVPKHYGPSNINQDQASAKEGLRMLRLSEVRAEL
jgi:hypothetical protein